MSLANQKLDSIEAEYRALSPRASRFASELAKQLSQLVERCGVALAVPVQRRVKSWDSLSMKLRRSPAPIETLRDTQDLVGLRLILLFRRDIEIVDTALEKSLRIIRVYDTDQLLRDDQFGYSSRHYVLGLPKEWASVPTFVGLEDLTAEIQVRTLAQHMWAEASNFLQYKREDSAPLSMRRALSRCSALLEMLDVEFDRVLQERDGHRKCVAVGGSRTRLDVDLLEKTLDAFLPQKNKSTEPYGELLVELEHFGIKTVDQLRKLIGRRRRDAERQENHQLAEFRNLLDSGVEPMAVDAKKVRRGICFSHAGWVRVMLGREFGRDKLLLYWEQKNAERPWPVFKRDEPNVRPEA
jgi:ppGpp synthetase/RelA/SpoT-type nucleotidyltranferase